MTKRAACGAPQIQGNAEKNCARDLTLRAWFPTILLCMAVPEAWVQLEPLKGQRGSFGRQPSLAPLHEAYAHGLSLL